MATLNKYKEHRQFSGGLEVVEVEYDFSKDAGAAGALDIIKMKEAMVLVDCYTKVISECTSAGSATLIWGVKSGDTDACLDATSGAVANLTTGAVIAGETAGKGLKLAADAVLEMTIGTADLTAGKVRFCMVLQKFN